MSKWITTKDGKRIKIHINNCWVSVKDKLPELFKNVLTINIEGKILINWLEDIENEEGYFAYDGKRVTHWMPLPEPPKE